MQVAISLLALALGYKVFADSHKEKEGLKLLGQVIGIVVMIGALLSVACGVSKCMSHSGCTKSERGCPTMAKTSCPMHGSMENSDK